MAGLTALVADEESLRDPSLLGLAGEAIECQRWLRAFSSGETARRVIAQEKHIEEVWVASCEDVSPINLAAAIKRDSPEKRVSLLSFGEPVGSLRSRAAAAHVDDLYSKRDFLARYAQRKLESSARVMSMQQTSELRSVADQGLQSARPIGAASAGPSAGNKRAFLLPVVSGSGGAGKSTVSTLAALMSHRLGFNTLLLDFDLQFGDAPVLLGLKDPVAIDRIIEDPSLIDKLHSSDGRPAVIAAPKRLEDSEKVVREAAPVLERLFQCFDVIVANTGSAWAEQHALLLENSSKALFLVDQRPSSLRACRHALELCARCGIASSPFLFAVNRCSKRAVFTSIDVSCALDGAHVVELLDGGSDVEDLLGAGMPFELLESSNGLCSSLWSVLVDILPDAQEAAKRLEQESSRGLSAFFKKNGRVREKRG